MEYHKNYFLLLKAQKFDNNYWPLDSRKFQIIQLYNSFKMLSWKRNLNPAQKLNLNFKEQKQKKNGFNLNCIVGYPWPTLSPFAALVPNPWFT